MTMPTAEQIENAMKDTALMAQFVLETASSLAQQNVAYEIAESLRNAQGCMSINDTLGALGHIREIQAALKKYPH